MVYLYDEIIISSAGIKGIALIGALNEFFKYYSIKQIKYYTGCSAGALICTLLNIGYTIDELNEIILKIDFILFQELKIINLIDKLGLDEGNKFTNFLKALFINKNLNINITFKELYIITNKILTITVVNITKGIVEYHNYMNTPDLNIILSLRMSTNIPLLFSPVFYNNNYYLDGALIDPYPYFYHKNTKKIGFWIFEKYEFNFIKNYEVKFVDKISTPIYYIINLLKIIYANYIKTFYKKIPKNTIYIDFDYEYNSIHFDIKLEDKIKMFNIGINKSTIFLKKKYLKKNKIFLKKKYFHLWKYILKNNDEN
jgi:predicted patatin/cPLA2 family phospholipase